MPVPALFWLTVLLAKPVIQVVPPAEPSTLMPVAPELTEVLLRLSVSVPAPAVVLASKALPVAVRVLLFRVAVKAPELPSERLTPLPVAPRTLLSLMVMPTVLDPEEVTSMALEVAPVVSRSRPRISTLLRLPAVAGTETTGVLLVVVRTRALLVAETSVPKLGTVSATPWPHSFWPSLRVMPPLSGVVPVLPSKM